jgi:hypothetical protein
LVTIISVVRRIIVVAVYDALAWFAHFQIALLSKYLARHNGRALGVEDLATCTAVMFTSEGSKGIATAETSFGIFVSHPEFAV